MDPREAGWRQEYESEIEQVISEIRTQKKLIDVSTRHLTGAVVPLPGSLRPLETARARLSELEPVVLALRERLDAQVRRLEAELAERAGSVSQDRADAVKARESLAKSVACLRDLTQRLLSAESVRQEQQMELELLRPRVQALTQQSVELSVKLEQAQSELEASETEVARLRARHEAASREREALLVEREQQLQAQASRLRAQDFSHKAELDKITAAHEDAERKLARLQAELATAKASMEEAWRSEASAREELRRLALRPTAEAADHGISPVDTAPRLTETALEAPPERRAEEALRELSDPFISTPAQEESAPEPQAAALPELPSLPEIPSFSSPAPIAEPVLEAAPEPEPEPEPPSPLLTPPPVLAAPQPDPFGAPQPDPFGAPQPDPFGAPQPDPFGAPQPDPFGAPQPDPFAKAKADPFAATQPDPFAAVPQDKTIVLPPPQTEQTQKYDPEDPIFKRALQELEAERRKKKG